MNKIFVENIQERDLVETVFLVRDKIIGMAKNGRPYMTLKLMDRTGEIEGRIWDRVDELSVVFDRDDFVSVSGKASVYMSKMQLVVQELERVEEKDVDLADFLPVSKRSLDEMIAELETVVAGLSDVHLKNLMAAFMADAGFMTDYTQAPAAKAMHHVCLGGLLEHSLAVAALAADIAERYPDLNRDLLIVGALLHDVGKVAELRFRRSFEYTDVGKLLGHIVIGVELLENKLRELDDFPEELTIHLKHLLLSHHGQYEYGSPKRPKTIEAVVLNFIDDLDSKINGVKTHIDKEPDNPSAWTQYHKHYDRYFFKGSRQKAVVKEVIHTGNLESGRAAPPPGQHGKSKKPRFGNTLEEQFKGKKLDLFTGERQDKKDE